MPRRLPQGCKYMRFLCHGGLDHTLHCTLQVEQNDRITAGLGPHPEVSLARVNLLANGTLQHRCSGGLRPSSLQLMTPMLDACRAMPPSCSPPPRLHTRPAALLLPLARSWALAWPWTLCCTGSSPPCPCWCMRPGRLTS